MKVSVIMHRGYAIHDVSTPQVQHHTLIFTSIPPHPRAPVVILIEG